MATTKYSKEYISWRGMCDRCYRLNATNYKYYGAKGVKVYGGWRGDGGFKKFLEHIGPRPSDNHSIDRFPDRDGNYEPGNVRWANKQEQSAGRKDFVIVIEYLGKSQTLAEWGRELGIAYETLRSRYKNKLPTYLLLKQGHSRKNSLR